MAENERNMPFALEAEQSVLGSILIDPERFTEVTDIINAEDFYLSEHAEIFSAMRDLFAENREIDLVTLIDMLVKRGV
jgi:replicative DNA helicase